MKLTDRALAALTSTTPRDLTVTGRKGLILRLEPTRDGRTRKTFRYRYKRDGKTSRVVLGEYPTLLGVADVHALHASCVRAVEAGGDPRPLIEAFHRDLLPPAAQPADGPTVKEVCDEFLTHYAERNRTRPEQARYLLEHNVLPRLGARPAASIRKRDIQAMLDVIVTRGSPILANRVQSLLKQAFAVAADRDLIETVPPFPRAKVGGEESVRTRVLSDEEIRTLWRGLETLAPPARPNGKYPRGKIGRPLALALKLQLVTAQRRGEIAAARWDDLVSETVKVGRRNVTQLSWRIPTNKSDRPHLVPLSPLAVDILDELRTLTGATDYWLPSVVTGDANAERDRSLTRAARKIRTLLKMADWRPHDLRRTARTGLARLGVRDEVAERVLNHAPRDRMVAVYNQHAYQAEMRQALDQWADRLRQIVRAKP